MGLRVVDYGCALPKSTTKQTPPPSFPPLKLAAPNVFVGVKTRRKPRKKFRF